MPRLPQLELQVNFEDGPDASWHVGGLHFEEVLNELYEAGIEIETDELDTDLADLLGATCELMLRRGDHPPRPIYGVVARVDDLGATNHHAFARVTVVPAFALSKQRINTRIWQDRSVQDIVREVLDASLSEYGRSVELGHLRRGAKPRDYCVQYGESDYDFICRLLEEEGITWYFVHDLECGYEVVTLCDDNEDYDKYVNVDDDANLPTSRLTPPSRCEASGNSASPLADRRCAHGRPLEQRDRALKLARRGADLCGEDDHRLARVCTQDLVEALAEFGELVGVRRWLGLARLLDDARLLDFGVDGASEAGATGRVSMACATAASTSSWDERTKAATNCSRFWARA